MLRDVKELGLHENKRDHGSTTKIRRMKSVPIPGPISTDDEEILK
jgi:hypothetical protein